MDELDLHLLNDFQRDLPLVTQPFAAMAARLGTTEAEVIARLRDKLRNEPGAARVAGAQPRLGKVRPSHVESLPPCSVGAAGAGPEVDERVRGATGVKTGQSPEEGRPGRVAPPPATTVISCWAERPLTVPVDVSVYVPGAVPAGMVRVPRNAPSA